ncbi:MAG: hypothetical protein NVV59_08955 [Chitinophagaceae bacterium]|nr:hypothetical protein [Chitinophagaceae bacterium]
MLLIMQFGSMRSRAQQSLTVVSVLEGKNNGIRKDSLRETIDVAYYSPLYSSILNPANDKYTNSVSLYVDENDRRVADSDFKVDVFLTLIWTDMHGIQDSINGKKLTIDYRRSQDTTAKHRAYIMMDSCRKLKIRIDSLSLNGALWDVTRMLVLENRMEISRQFIFDCENTVTGLDHETGPVSSEMNFDKLLVSWDPSTAPGTTDYDLEWSWIDYEARDRYKVAGVYNANSIFKNNSTRITIPGNQISFGIPLLYDGEGLLFYRIRPIQIGDNDQVIPGTWTEIGSNYFHFEEGHEPSLNWQVSTSFAEEGKHKTVIQYFDGTLRNRQSVTKDNDTETTVIAETLYDYQGRPVINILPAPTLNKVIEYAHNFNRFSSDVYAKDLYDIVPELDLACNMVTPPLDSVSGTSQYYSSNNLLINSRIGNLHNYIPAAFGYPFTETLFYT